MGGRSSSSCCRTRRRDFSLTVYGGNRDMAGWKMIGYPGARYDYRDWVVVIVGLGWTGSILAHELAATGLNVVAIERGPWRDTATDFPPAYAQDELRYHIRHDLFLRPAQVTMTFRHNVRETALPIRSWGSFMPPNGVGGGGVHWNAETLRFLPSDFQLKTHLTKRYGEKFLPADMTIQDWGVSYDELEPYYDKFEYLCGTSGKAGNIKGQIQAGGNPFEGSRSREYPTPPQKQPYGPTLFAQAAAAMGYKPSLSHPEICPRHTPTRSESLSGLVRTAGSANGSVVGITRKPARRPRFCPHSCASPTSKRARSARC